MANGETTRTAGGTDERPQTTPDRSDAYWLGIVTVFLLPIASFLGVFVVGIARGTPEPISFANTPIVATLLWTVVLSFFFGPALLVYCISRDTRELATDFEDVTERGMIAVGIFALFTGGLYLLWYPLMRWRKVKQADGPRGQPGPRQSIRLVWGGVRAAVSSLWGWTTNGTGRTGATSSSADGSRTPDGGRPADGHDTSTAPSNGNRPDSEAIRKRAERAIERAETAARDGEYETAIERYEDGIERYETLLAELEAGESDERRQTIRTALEDARESVEEIVDRRERIETVRERLRDAESSFQTAIAGHVGNNRTVAGRDYRQARDQYDRALTVLEECEDDVLDAEDGMTISVAVEGEQVPAKLAAFPAVSETDREVLADAGIGTLTDLKDCGRDQIRTLRDRDAIDESLSNRLEAAIWWHGSGERTFVSRSAIERQRDRAESGHRMVR